NKLVIYVKGKQAGTEQYTIQRKPDQWVARAQSELTIPQGNTTVHFTFEPLLVLNARDLSPLRYDLTYTVNSATNKLSARFQKQEVSDDAFLAGRRLHRRSELHEDVVVLENSIYHQYELVVRKYNRRRGGEQIFYNYVPIIAREIKLSVQHRGKVRVEGSGGSLDGEHFVLDVGGILAVTVVVDSKGNLLRISIPEQQVEVVRSDLAG
ncbi:MAG: hypothetical protein HY652_12440, partial [Acidobacteria bacterium]|nr:hypothetical protein [Acidobacteriota bacterium]